MGRKRMLKQLTEFCTNEVYHMPLMSMSVPWNVQEMGGQTLAPPH